MKKRVKVKKPLLRATATSALLLQVTLALSTSEVSAQPFLEAHGEPQDVQALVAIGQEVEALASPCVAANSSTSTACADFLNAIDGELGASYARHCKQLRNWRSALISRRFNATAGAVASAAIEPENAGTQVDGSGESTPQQELDLMIATAALCDNGSRLSNSEAVVTAFAVATSTRPAGSNSSSAYSAAAVDRLFRAQQNETLQRQERLRQQQSIENEQQRTLQQSENTNRQLEAELLRQQLRRSPPR